MGKHAGQPKDKPYEPTQEPKPDSSAPGGGKRGK